MLDLMAEIHHDYRHREQEYLDRDARRPTAFSAYNLGLLYYDKRMLLKAEEWMEKAIKLFRTQGTIAITKNDERGCAATRAELEGCRDDLAFLREQKTRFCSREKRGPGNGGGGGNKEEEEEEDLTTKTVTPKLLPNFVARFEGEERGVRGSKKSAWGGTGSKKSGGSNSRSGDSAGGSKTGSKSSGGVCGGTTLSHGGTVTGTSKVSGTAGYGVSGSSEVVDDFYSGEEMEKDWLQLLLERNDIDWEM